MIRVVILTNPKTRLQLHVLDRGDYIELLTSDERFLSPDRVPFRRWYYSKTSQWVLYKGKRYYR